MPVGLLGEQRNATDGDASANTRRTSSRSVDRSGARSPCDHRGAGEPADVGVQRVGRLPHRGGAAGAAVGEQQRLQHLVRAVGHEHLGRVDVVQPGDGGPQVGRGPVGIAVPVDGGRRPSRRRPASSAGGAVGRLVRVEAHVDVDLGRVVALHERDVVAGPDHASPRPGRRRAQRAGGGSTRRGRRSPRWSASVSTNGATRSNAGAVDGDDVHLLHEVVDGEGAAEAGRAERGQHVARSGDVVADRRRGQRPAEHGAGVAHQRHQRLGVGRHELQVLGGDEVGHRPWPPRARRPGPGGRPGRSCARCRPAGAPRRRAGRARRRWRRPPRATT